MTRLRIFKLIILILALVSCSRRDWQSYHVESDNQRISIFLPNEWSLYDDEAFFQFEDSLLNQEKVFGLPHILDLRGIWSPEGTDSYITLSVFSNEKKQDPDFVKDYINVHYSADSLSSKKVFTAHNNKVFIRAFYQISDGFLQVSSLLEKDGETAFLEFFIKNPDDKSMELISEILSSIK